LTNRAMKVYEQVSILEPTRSEPYLNALKLCESKFNLEAVQWAALGLLEQAWSDQNDDKWRQARGAVQSAVNLLKVAKQFKAAEQLEKKIFNASKRDVMIVVSWTGEADMDLTVSEPAGTLCSHRNPRTTSGGVLLGDAFTQIGKASTKMTSESYMCPQAFKGEYRARLRRAWGRPTANRVTVDLYTNWGTIKGKHIRKQVSVGDEDRVIVFKLDEGRREESLAERLVSNAVNRQQAAIRRDVLLKQLDAVHDSYSTNKALASHERSFGRRRLDLRPGAPRNPGFQPVIITLSEGATMSAQAVISADRRYVRFTGVPFFSGIGDVTTFNIGTGETSRMPFNNDNVGSDDIAGAGGGGAAGGGAGGVPPNGGGGPANPNCPLDAIALILEDFLPASLPASSADTAHTIIVQCQSVGQIPDGSVLASVQIGCAPALQPLAPGFYRATIEATICVGNGITLPAGTIIYVAP
ncbi:MAG: hypothetical protein N2C14_14435, partial [Planctomycetales bacterium]